MRWRGSARGTPTSLLGPQGRIISGNQGEIERLLVGPGVIRRSNWGCVRRVEGPNEVLAANFYWVHAYFGGEHIHGPLNCRGRFWTPGPAVGSYRRGVGDEGFRIALHLRNGIHASGHHPGKEWQEGSKQGIGSGIL
jgi:hypothetical protein